MHAMIMLPALFHALTWGPYHGKSVCLLITKLGLLKQHYTPSQSLARHTVCTSVSTNDPWPVPKNSTIGIIFLDDTHGLCITGLLVIVIGEACIALYSRSICTFLPAPELSNGR